MPRKRTLTAEDLGSAAWKELRLRILARDGHLCQVCGRAATHVDHIQPRSQGGRSVPENLRATCQRCNLLKSRSEASLAALARRASGVDGQEEERELTGSRQAGSDPCTCPASCRCKTDGRPMHPRHWCL